MADYIGAIGKLLADTAMGPPGLVAPLRPPLKHDPTLQDALDSALEVVQNEMAAARTAHPELPETLEPFAFAVVDLTNGAAGYGRNSPAYAGFNDTKLLAIGSLAKLLPLYVAHLLRFTAREVATATGTTTVSALGPLVRKHLQRLGAADDTFPLIEDMFEFVEGIVEFKTGGTRWPGAVGIISNADLELIDTEDDSPASSRRQAVTGTLPDSLPAAARRSIVQAQLADVAFREQLRLMARWSNNQSATIVIHAIGFPLLWKLGYRAALFRSGGWERLIDPRKGTLDDPGGIFLGRDYSGNFWTSRPKPAPVLNKQPSQAGNARAVAQLMTSLAHELIDDEARISMREMLRRPPDFIGVGRAESSPIGIGMALDPISWRADQQIWNFGEILGMGTVGGYALRNGELAASKIGIVNTTGLNVACNALLVRSVRAATITAVLVGICNWHGTDSDVLKVVLNSYGKAMAAALDLRHP